MARGTNREDSRSALESSVGEGDRERYRYTSELKDGERNLNRHLHISVSENGERDRKYDRCSHESKFAEVDRERNKRSSETSDTVGDNDRLELEPIKGYHSRYGYRSESKPRERDHNRTHDRTKSKHKVGDHDRHRNKYNSKPKEDDRDRHSDRSESKPRNGDHDHHRDMSESKPRDGDRDRHHNTSESKCSDRDHDCHCDMSEPKPVDGDRHRDVSVSNPRDGDHDHHIDWSEPRPRDGDHGRHLDRSEPKPRDGDHDRRRDRSEPKLRDGDHDRHHSWSETKTREGHRGSRQHEFILERKDRKWEGQNYLPSPEAKDNGEEWESHGHSSKTKDSEREPKNHYHSSEMKNRERDHEHYHHNSALDNWEENDGQAIDDSYGKAKEGDKRHRGDHEQSLDTKHLTREDRYKSQDDRHDHLEDGHFEEEPQGRRHSSHARQRSKKYPQNNDINSETSLEEELKNDLPRWGNHRDSVDSGYLYSSVDQVTSGCAGSIERQTSSHKRKDNRDSEDHHYRRDKRSRTFEGDLDEKSEKKSRFYDGRREENFESVRTSDEGLDEARDKKKLSTDGEKGEEREKRRFKDHPREDNYLNGDIHRRSFKEGKTEEARSEAASNSARHSTLSSSVFNTAAVQTCELASQDVPDINSEYDHSIPSKVSSISTTNENKGVSVIRSHEVPGKSSTDGATSSSAGKGGNLSLDALAKAKKALQMQKELSEKLKKIPVLNKADSVGSDSKKQFNKDGAKFSLSAPSSSTVASAVAAPSFTKSFTVGINALAGLATSSNIEAVKRAQELAARMGFHQDPEFGPLINLFPGHMVPDLSTHQKPVKAPVLRLDALGREVDEHGNVIDMIKPTSHSTLKVNINKQKKEAFQILKPELDATLESNPYFDSRMGINKTKLLRPKRMTFQFVEEGKWSKQAELIKFKSQFGEAQAKELKTKQAQLAKAKAELADINPNLIELSERAFTKEKVKDPIPDVEWWDMPLLVSAGYPDLFDGSNEEKLKMDRITIYIEHPLPIEPPAEPAAPPPQPLKLTKKEQKKLRTQRRLAKEKDRQEMVRQGLLEPPKPKVKMSNLMKVLGSEATQDPTRLEMEIRAAAAEREQAHVDRNLARKLTPAERREKKERKLFEDPNTLETLVSVYKINSLAHPQTRFKVDVNAQENRLSGCAVISDNISVVVVEGGRKSIKRYGKLMLRRIDWASAVPDEDAAGNDDAGTNKCLLVWQGSVAKSSFNRFLVHQCRTEAAARKVFSDAGVGHYWDLAVNFKEEV